MGFPLRQALGIDEVLGIDIDARSEEERLALGKIIEIPHLWGFLMLRFFTLKFLATKDKGGVDCGEGLIVTSGF